jgi:hypothetical protein
MFDPIHSHMMGPSNIDGTEFGDTWVGAMTKVNAMFETLFDRANTAVDPSIGVNPDFVKALEARFEKAEDEIANHLGFLSDAMFKIDALEAKLAAYVGLANEPAPKPPIPAVTETPPGMPTA